MLRFWTACFALILAPLAAADTKELKPKFGDIGGVFYTEVSKNREACRQAKRKCAQRWKAVSGIGDFLHPETLRRHQQQVTLLV